MEQLKMLLLDFNPVASLGNRLRGILESFNLEIQFRQESVRVHGSALGDSDLSKIISRFHPDVIFLVLSSSLLKQAGGLCQSIREEPSEIPILVVIEQGEPDDMVELLKVGVADFITPPLKAVDILPRVWRVLEWTHRREPPIHRLKEKLGLKQFVGENPAFLTEIKKIPLVAKSDVSVLILGETGTGKELCVRAIHYLSPRTGKPFIPVNCGAIPVELVENELFGHERGAFTGASTSRPGLIHEADGGTLFLDEIDCLPPPAQVKLLRFLQDKEYRLLGSTRMRQADIRVIAATNIDLRRHVQAKRFRKDLYYRLNVLSLYLPPLRERIEDIPLLAVHFLTRYGNQHGRKSLRFSAGALQKLLAYSWPGNVRELEGVIQRAVILASSPVLQPNDIEIPFAYHNKMPGDESFREVKTRVIEQFERIYLIDLLTTYKGNISQAAKHAGKERRSFQRLLKKYGLDRHDFQV